MNKNTFKLFEVETEHRTCKLELPKNGIYMRKKEHLNNIHSVL